MEDTATGSSVRTSFRRWRAGADVVVRGGDVARQRRSREAIEAAGLPYRFAVSAHDLGLG